MTGDAVTTADDDFSWLDDDDANDADAADFEIELIPQRRTVQGKKPGRPSKPMSKAAKKRMRKKRQENPRVNHNTMTPAKWRKCLEYVAAHGLKRDKAAKRAGVTKAIFEAYLVSNVAAAKQLDEARLVWLRRSWDMDQLDELFTMVASGSTTKAAFEYFEFDETKVAAFYTLMRRDRLLREQYDAVRELQAESWADDTIDIADNAEEDLYEDNKGNIKVIHGKVQRDKLRIDARWRFMGALNRRRFGEHKHIDHGGEIAVNHSAVLSGARKRLERVNEKRAPVTIENKTGVVDE